MNFDAYTTMYDEAKRQDNIRMSADEFYWMQRHLAQPASERVRQLWERQWSAEAAWINSGRPYVKVYPAYYDSFATSRLDVPMWFLQMPMPVFSVRLPENECDGIKSLLVAETTEGDGVRNLVILTLVHRDSETIKRTHNVLWSEAQAHTTLDQHLHNMKPVTETFERTDSEHAFADIVVASRIALSTILLLNGGNRMVNDGSTPIQPDVLTDDLCKFVNGDMATRERLADRARRRGKNGWTIGREISLPRNQSRRESSGLKRGPVGHQFFRCGHFRMQACGRLWQDNRLIFIPPTIVRPDLPLLTERSQGYRVGAMQ